MSFNDNPHVPHKVHQVPELLMSRLLCALRSAEQEYKDSIEAQGGCDHAINVCVCAEVHQLENLQQLRAELGAIYAGVQA